MNFQQKKGLGLVLAALVAMICLVPGTAAASGGVSVSSDALDNSAAARKGEIVCATAGADVSDAIDIYYDLQRPFGHSANPLWEFGGNFAYYPNDLICSDGSIIGHLSIGGDISAVAAFACPRHYVEEQLNVDGGSLHTGSASINITSMTWTLAGNQFAITGSGVDQQGQQATLSGYATHSRSDSYCDGSNYSRQYVTDLVLTATY